MAMTNSGKPIIALDYDGTITTNVEFWMHFIMLSQDAGYAVAIVTMRTWEEKQTMDEWVQTHPWIITTSRRAKQEFCASFGIVPSIWIDDNPAWIYTDAADATDADTVVPQAQLDMQQAFLNS